MIQGNSFSAATMAGLSPNLPPIVLSIVIATIKPWPEVRRCLDSLHSQARAAGAEIIVADGHGKGLPDDVADWDPYVIWLKRVGGSVFHVGGLAMARARGEIVAGA